MEQVSDSCSCGSSYLSDDGTESDRYCCYSLSFALDRSSSHQFEILKPKRVDYMFTMYYRYLYHFHFYCDYSAFTFA